MKTYTKPQIVTLKADEILEAMGPVQGYSGTTTPGSPADGLEPLGAHLGSPYEFGRRR